MPDPLLVSDREAARLCGRAPRTWTRDRASGKVGPQERRLGGAVLWSTVELAEWIASPKPDGTLMDRREWLRLRAGREAVA